MSKNNMDYREGYCDGLAGAGMQERPIQNPLWHNAYNRGFAFGSFQRKAMLANQANAERSPC